MTFQGVGGEAVTLDESGSRIVQVYMFAMNSSLLPYMAASLLVNVSEVVCPTVLLSFPTFVCSQVFTPFYKSESELWSVRPLSRPKCGFTGLECPADFVKEYLVYTIIAAFIVILALLAGCAGLLYTMQ